MMVRKIQVAERIKTEAEAQRVQRVRHEEQQRHAARTQEQLRARFGVEPTSDGQD
jgi:hypothetical protein